MIGVSIPDEGPICTPENGDEIPCPIAGPGMFFVTRFGPGCTFLATGS
jgi:hypothetical protein